MMYVSKDSVIMQNNLNKPFIITEFSSLVLNVLVVDVLQDICISAVKEKDIEAKLKQVTVDWAVVDLSFANFKNRGELLIKAAETLEIITLLEDSLMILNSLASNR